MRERDEIKSKVYSISYGDKSIWKMERRREVDSAERGIIVNSLEDLFEKGSNY